MVWLPFRNMLAKRTFVLFLGCTALPLVVITTVADFHVRRYLEFRIGRELRATSRVYETAVFDALLLLEDRFLNSLPPSTTPPSATYGARQSTGGDEPEAYFVEIGHLSAPNRQMPSLAVEELAFLETGGVLLRLSALETERPKLTAFTQQGEDTFYGVVEIAYLRQRIANFSQWGGVHLALLREDGTVLASSLPTAEVPTSILPDSPRSPRFDLVGSIHGEPIIGVVNTIFLKGRFGCPNWRMVLLKPKGELFEPLSTFRRTLYLMMMISLATICLFMLISIRRYTRQIEELEEGTERIRNHDFEHRIAIRSGDEFARLGGAFNSMTHSLAEYRQNLARQNEELRDKVAVIRAAREKEAVMQAQLARAEHLESLGKLAGGVAHDFNNLLGIIICSAEVVSWETSEESPAKRSLDSIRTAAEKATELCRQMMVYAGRGTYEFEPIDLAHTIRGVNDLMKISVGKLIAIRYEMDGPAPMIDGDPSQILQVVLNFITNAAAAIGNARGEITIRLAIRSCPAEELRSTYLHSELPAGRYACLEVEDNGCGMDRETIARIFDPFFTTKETGHGLGLATVLGIIQAHRGTVKVVSQPGQGSIFTVYFPLRNEQ